MNLGLSNNFTIFKSKPALFTLFLMGDFLARLDVESATGRVFGVSAGVAGIALVRVGETEPAALGSDGTSSVCCESLDKI